MKDGKTPWRSQKAQGQEVTGVKAKRLLRRKTLRHDPDKRANGQGVSAPKNKKLSLNAHKTLQFQHFL